MILQVAVRAFSEMWPPLRRLLTATCDRRVESLRNACPDAEVRITCGALVCELRVRRASDLTPAMVRATKPRVRIFHVPQHVRSPFPRHDLRREPRGRARLRGGWLPA